MINILDNFGHKNNFWKYNPQFLASNMFNDFYKSDKSKGKEVSSRVMWGIVFLVHPNSVFKNLDLFDKQTIIANDYIKDKKFNWSSINNLTEHFSLLMLTMPRRSLDSWEVKLRERDEFIKSTKYSIENATELDRVLANTEKLWKQYKAIREEILSEGDIVINKGGNTPSLSDDGRI